MKNHFYILLPMLILLIKSTAIGQVQQYPSGPLYEEGVIYLKLKDTFAEQISYPPNGGSVSSSLDSLYSTFQENGVTTYAKPFAIFATTQFDRIYKIYFGNSSTSLEFIDELRLISIVDYAEQVPLKAIFQTVPNDPSIPNNSYHLQLINAFNAFDIHTGGNSIVAIVDDAVLTTHEDLAANIVAGWDAADLDNDPNPPLSASATYFSHGTHVAGIAAGATNNSIGIASIGWNTKIMPVKTVSDNGNPQFPTYGFEGIAWAATHGADVINMSWGGNAYSQSEYMVIEMARQMNVILIAAAGNDSGANPLYPAAYGEGTTAQNWEQIDPLMVIAVASLDASNNVSGFSNFGTWVDVSAYGSNIYSTVANGGYSIFSGTSMASPMVAGLAALMVSYSNSSSVDDIINCLLNSANDEINDPNIHPGNLPGSLGVGVIDAYDALRCIGGDCSSPLAVIFPSSQTICPNESITLSTNPCINHLWSTGETTSEITVFQPGNYSVTITYSGGCTASSSIEIHAAITNAVMIIDEASGLIEGDGIICGGGSANTVNLTAWWGESYSWNIFGATSQSITGLGVGTDILPISYNYSVTVTNVGGCTGVTDVLSGVIKHLQLPDAQIFIDENSGNPNNGIICLGESVTLSVPIIAGNSYIWNNGNTTNSITVTPAFTTVYTVTVTNTNGCTNQNTATVILDCELDDCGCPANSIVISNQNSLAVLTGTGVLPQNPTDPVNLIVLGNLHIDITTPAPEALNYSYTFPPNSTICMNENARIIIFPGCSLKLDRTTIKGCEKLWENIIVNDGGKLFIDNLSTIQDARLGVTVEKNAKFYARNSKFDKNHVSINIPIGGNPNVSLIGNTFDCSGTLLPTDIISLPGSVIPTSGLKSWAGIYSTHETLLSISKSNTFKNLSNGIISDGQGSLIVTRSSFENILENPEYNFSGFGIHASPPLRGSRLIVTGFGNDPLNDPSSFKNCSVGVHGENITMSINDNNMQGIQKTGVEGHLLGKQSFDVRSNFIESEITGVSLIEAPLSSVIVRDNVLNISTDGTGIRMENVNDVYSSPLLEGIRNNIIKMKGGTQNGGILILNSAGLLVKRNDIDLSLSDNKLFGIKVDGSSNNAFSCNTVTGAGTANNQSKGFMITSSQDNFYTCNTNSANHIGVQFNNVCNGTEFRGNQFLQNGTGLQYSNMGMTQTGDQSWRGNTWDNGQIGVEFQSGGTGIPLSSRYFIQEPFSIASDLWPVNAPNYPDWFFNIPPQTNDLIFECPADLNTCDVDDNFTNPGPCEENDFLMHVANGLTDTSFSGGIKWIAESYLFRRLVEDCTDAVSSNATLSSFFNNHLNTAVGKFQAVAMGREELFELDSSKQQIFDDYSIGLSNFIDSISIVDDSLGLANANEIPGFLSQKEAYLQNLGAMAGPLFALASDIFDQQTTTAAQLKSENNDISVVDVFEVNEKTVNQVYLNTFAVGVSEFSPAQVVQLQSIADQCPVSGGNAVYMARAMLDIKYPQSYDDHTICTNIRERTGGNGLDDETVDQLLVYPNPAGREINLSFAPVKSQATLILSDVFGRQIIDVKLVEGISNFNLQTTDLSSGLYFIKLYYDNDKVLSRTVVISK